METTSTPAAIDAGKTTRKIEALKAQLLKELLTDAPALTTCYDNWFASQINYEKSVLRSARDEHAKEGPSISDTLEAWTRARALFFTLCAPALQELAATVAQQIEIEFAEHHVAASDVADNLRNTPLAEILQHMN